MTDTTANPYHQTFETTTAGSVEMPAGKLAAVPARPVPLRRKAINARYELAERSADLNEQFGRASSSSGRQVTSHTDRATMRDRIRHEMFEADPWLAGSGRTTVVSVIGRGPWLEVKIPNNPDVSKDIADKFNHWFRNRVNGPRKLRTMAHAKNSDGSGLAMVVHAPNVRGAVKLSFVPFEDEQIRADTGSGSFHDQTNYLLDGKEFDEVGDPARYWISERHPAEHPEDRPKAIAAAFVLDVWEQLRPSQGRGVSAYATATKNGPMRRTYRRATIDAATTAAKLSFLMKTNVDRFDDGDTVFEDVDALTGVPLLYGEGMALPAGWDPFQLKPEHPTTGHDEFMRSNVAEMGRPAGQPGQVAMGDAKGLNFASGSLGRADWADDVDVQRQDWETLGLDKLFAHWLAEAALVGEIPREFHDVDKVPHEYRWTRRRHQDTNKEYSGRAKAIATGQTSRAFWQTDDGINPDAEDESAAAGFGVDVETYRRALFFSTFGDAAAQAIGQDEPPPDDETDDETEERAENAEKTETPDFERRTQNAGFVNRRTDRTNGTGGRQFRRIRPRRP